MALSKTNTDTLCLNVDKSSNAIVRSYRKFVYRYNLWTGLYMLERHERFVFHLIVGMFCITSFMYFSFFAKGFVDGWSDTE